MHSRTQTQSMETDADPQSIVALLADPTRILDWAPAFADTITGDDQTGWHGTRGGQDFAFRVVTHPDAGTADYLREIAPDRQGGAYLRAVPRPGGGSVVTMTMPVTPGAEPAAVATTLRNELTALVQLVESHLTHAQPHRASPPDYQQGTDHR